MTWLNMDQISTTMSDENDENIRQFVQFFFGFQNILHRELWFLEISVEISKKNKESDRKTRKEITTVTMLTPF